MSASQPIRTENFTASIGVEAQLNYTDGAYHNIANVLADLQYLGIDLVRAATLNSAGNLGGQNDYALAAEAGIKFDLVVNGNNSISSTLSQIDAFEKAHPGSVASIEGPNEIDNSPITYDGLTGGTAAIAFQNALYIAAEADAEVSGTPIYSFSVTPTSAPDGGYNEAALHPYATSGAEPLATIESAIKAAPAGAATVITETGYSTLAGWSSGVDEATQAKLLLNTLFDAAKLGVQTTYIYELLDAYADPTGTDSGDHYGLFDINNDPKPVAVAIHNLMSILSDAGSNAASFQTASLNYTVSNLPADGSSLTFEKSSGVYDVVLWNEPTIWNATTHSEVAASTVLETVNFGVNVSEVKIYDPLTGTSAIETLTNVSEVTVAVTDHPIIIEVSGISAASSSAVEVAGSTAANTVVATANGQTLSSTSAHTVLEGGSFSNVTLEATSRINTTLVAGTGYDVLVGAMSGADTFVFGSVNASSASHPDLITAFSAANDTIDLSGLNGVSTTGQSEALVWTTQFTHQAGQAILAYNSHTNITTLSVDTTGAGVADFALQIHGDVTTSAHFVL